MTDWGGVHTSMVTIQSGNDMVTPGGQSQARTMLGMMTGDTTYVYVGDLQLAAIRVLRTIMNSIHMNELTEGAVEIESYTDYLAGIEDYDAPVTLNERGLVDYIKTEKGEIIPFYANVSAPEAAETGEVFTITANVTKDVIAFKVLNESGAKVTIKSISKEANPDGSVKWSINTSVATAGNRTLTIVPISEDYGYLDEMTVAITITDSIDQNSIISAGFTKAAVLKNAPATLKVVAGQKITNINVVNENGGKMGKTLVAKTANGDGSWNWEYTMKIGTAGDRQFTVEAGKMVTTTSGWWPVTALTVVDTAVVDIIVA